MLEDLSCIDQKLTASAILLSSLIQQDGKSPTDDDVWSGSTREQYLSHISKSLILIKSLCHNAEMPPDTNDYLSVRMESAEESSIQRSSPSLSETNPAVLTHTQSPQKASINREHSEVAPGSVHRGFLALQAMLQKVSAGHRAPSLSMRTQTHDDGFVTVHTVVFRYEHTPLPGWTKEIHLRLAGKSKGKVDVHYTSPNSQRRFRARGDLQLYLEGEGLIAISSSSSSSSSSTSLPFSSRSMLDRFDFHATFCVCQQAQQEDEANQATTFVECSFGRCGCNGWVHSTCIGLGLMPEERIHHLPRIICPFCSVFLQHSGQLHMYPRDTYLHCTAFTTGFACQIVHLPPQIAVPPSEFSSALSFISTKEVREGARDEEELVIEECNLPHRVWGLEGTTLSFCTPVLDDEYACAVVPEIVPLRGDLHKLQRLFLHNGDLVSEEPRSWGSWRKRKYAEALLYKDMHKITTTHQNHSANPDHHTDEMDHLKSTSYSKSYSHKRDSKVSQGVFEEVSVDVEGSGGVYGDMVNADGALLRRRRLVLWPPSFHTSAQSSTQGVSSQGRGRPLEVVQREVQVGVTGGFVTLFDPLLLQNPSVYTSSLAPAVTDVYTNTVSSAGANAIANIEEDAHQDDKYLLAKVLQRLRDSRKNNHHNHHTITDSNNAQMDTNLGARKSAHRSFSARSTASTTAQPPTLPPTLASSSTTSSSVARHREALQALQTATKQTLLRIHDRMRPHALKATDKSVDDFDWSAYLAAEYPARRSTRHNIHHQQQSLSHQPNRRPAKKRSRSARMTVDDDDDIDVEDDSDDVEVEGDGEYGGDEDEEEGLDEEVMPVYVPLRDGTLCLQVPCVAPSATAPATINATTTGASTSTGGSGLSALVRRGRRCAFCLERFTRSSPPQAEEVSEEVHKEVKKEVEDGWRFHAHCAYLRARRIYVNPTASASTSSADAADTRREIVRYAFADADANTHTNSSTSAENQPADAQVTKCDETVVKEENMDVTLSSTTSTTSPATSALITILGEYTFQAASTPASSTSLQRERARKRPRTSSADDCLDEEQSDADANTTNTIPNDVTLTNTSDSLTAHTSNPISTDATTTSSSAAALSATMTSTQRRGRRGVCALCAQSGGLLLRILLCSETVRQAVPSDAEEGWLMHVPCLHYLVTSASSLLHIPPPRPSPSLSSSSPHTPPSSVSLFDRVHSSVATSFAASFSCVLCGGRGGLLLRCLARDCVLVAHSLCVSWQRHWQLVTLTSSVSLRSASSADGTTEEMTGKDSASNNAFAHGVADTSVDMTANDGAGVDMNADTTVDTSASAGVNMDVDTSIDAHTSVSDRADTNRHHTASVEHHRSNNSCSGCGFFCAVHAYQAQQQPGQPQ